MKLSSLRGKVVMLDMFWSQCPHSPCWGWPLIQRTTRIRWAA
jgi:hypothetical protein